MTEATQYTFLPEIPRQYEPSSLDRLAAAIIERAVLDARLNKRRDETGVIIDPQEVHWARVWLKRNLKPWCEVLVPDLEVPEDWG